MAISTNHKSKQRSSLTKKTTVIALIALLIVISIPVLLYQQQDNLSGALISVINPNPFHTDNNAEEPHSFPLTGKTVESIEFNKNINIKSTIIKNTLSSEIVDNKTTTPVDITLHSFAGRITVEGEIIYLEGVVNDISAHSQ